MYVCRGDVVTMECVEKLIRKDMIHPLTDRKLKDKDIIPLQRVSKGIGTLIELVSLNVLYTDILS